METIRPQITKQASAEGTSLDSDLETFRDDLRKASEIRLYEGLAQVRATPAKSGTEIASLFNESFPEEPQLMGSHLAAGGGEQHFCRFHPPAQIVQLWDRRSVRSRCFRSLLAGSRLYRS
jgi:hypothetical protein